MFITRITGISLSSLRNLPSTSTFRYKTIFALSSGSLPSAVAIIRISGSQSEEALKILTKKDDFKPKELFYTKIYDQESNLLDRAMAVMLPGPHTFTGEDTAEIFLHGSRAVVNSVCKALSKIPGVESAKAGEFTKRAFFNSKLNIAQVEALSDLINAETDSQRRLALRQNDAGSYLNPYREDLIQIMAELEAQIDFADDVVDDKSHVVEKVENLLKSLRRLKRSAERGCLIRDGVKVALIGRTNAGKSSLINRLAERDIAIVSDISGTTRDSLETKIQLNSIPVFITDTAGIRDSSDPLEVEGIRRSILRAQEANIILLIIDSTSRISIEQEIDFLLSKIDVPENSRLGIVLNKSDLVNLDDHHALKSGLQNLNSKYPFILTSCKQEDGLNSLLDWLGSTLATQESDEGDDLILSRYRHVELLNEAVKELEEFLNVIQRDAAMAAQNLRHAADAIGEISGTIVNEHILDKIFSQFCIGK